MDTLTHAIAGACVATAAAQSMMPEYIGIAATTGFVAALLPDLDYLFVLARKKPILAWKYHRVALHNIFILPLLALVAVAISGLLLVLSVPFKPEWSYGIEAFSNQAMSLYLIAVLALMSHLLLDYITSFGSAFLYPLSNQRFALGTHFLTDPVIFIMATAGWAFDVAASALLAISLYLILAVALKYSATHKAKSTLRSCIDNEVTPKLFPRPGAPWRWIAIAEQASHYAFFYTTPISSDAVSWVDKGSETTASAIHHKDPLLNHFVDMSLFPRFEDTYRDNKPAIVVEDIQWWWSLPTRPMAFSAVVDQQEITHVRESRKLDKGPTGEAAPVPLISHEEFLND